MDVQTMIFLLSSPTFSRLEDGVGGGVVGHEVHSQYHNSHTIILCMPIRAVGSRQSSLFIFCLIVALIYFVYRYHDFSVPETFCPEVRGGVLRSHNGPHRILRSRYVVEIETRVRIPSLPPMRGRGVVGGGVGEPRAWAWTRTAWMSLFHLPCRRSLVLDPSS
jgi:hypothetical protein